MANIACIESGGHISAIVCLGKIFLNDVVAAQVLFTFHSVRDFCLTRLG